MLAAFRLPLSYTGQGFVYWPRDDRNQGIIVFDAMSLKKHPPVDPMTLGNMHELGLGKLTGGLQSERY